MDFKKPDRYKSINNSQVYKKKEKTYSSIIYNFFSKLYN
uniref:Uncharacterized protein n=1 Tax=viral metagenome TaxID=1070528 RepID=A0A6C0IWN6_9ZZZZ